VLSSREWATQRVSVVSVRKLLFLISAVVLVETVFFTAIAPLVPSYTESFGLSKAGAGLLVGSYAAGGFLGALPGGLLAVRVGVKQASLIGLALLAVLGVVFGFARSVWLLDLSRFGQGVGSAVAWTGALAWLVSESPRERRGERIGLVLGAAAFGALLGPVVGTLATLAGTRFTFSLVGAVCLLLGVWGTQLPRPKRGSPQSLSRLLPASRRPGIVMGVWLLLLPSVMFGILGVLAPLRLSRLGVSGSGIGAVFLVAALLEAAASVLFGRWADRVGRELPLRTSLVVSALVLAAFPIGGDRWTFALLVLIAATTAGAFFAPATALLSDQAERAGLELTLGFVLLNLAWAPGNLLGAVAGGWCCRACRRVCSLSDPGGSLRAYPADPSAPPGDGGAARLS
jgi:predicted MFS family arabinose efflux permease